MTQQIPEETITQFKEEIMGKRVQVWTEKTGKVTGICAFFGYNRHFPSWGLQITLDRMPITNVELKNIKIVES